MFSPHEKQKYWNVSADLVLRYTALENDLELNILIPPALRMPGYGHQALTAHARGPCDRGFYVTNSVPIQIESGPFENWAWHGIAIYRPYSFSVAEWWFESGTSKARFIGDGGDVGVQSYCSWGLGRPSEGEGWKRKAIREPEVVISVMSIGLKESLIKRGASTRGACAKWWPYGCNWFAVFRADVRVLSLEANCPPFSLS